MPSSHSVQFDIAPEVISLGLNGIFLFLTDLCNRDTDPEFEAEKARALAQLVEDYTKRPPKQDPILKGYRDLHTAVQFSNRNYPASSEALAENLLRTRALVHVNLLVDIYNLVSLETRLSLGAHDVAKVDGNIHLRPMDGTETFVPIGASEPKPPRPGGYAYIDDANDVICMLESRQDEKTKITPASADVFFIIQGNPAVDHDLLARAARRLVELVTKYCGGQVQVLYPTNLSL